MEAELSYPRNGLRVRMQLELAHVLASYGLSEPRQGPLRKALRITLSLLGKLD